MKRKYKKANSRRSSKKKRLRHFGGRAGARGVNYESRVAAFIAANALCGDGTALWDGVDGSNIANITLQAPEAVDDIIIGLKGAETDRIFISAKHRAKSVPLTEQSGAFTETVDAFVTQFRSAAAEARKPPRFIWALPSSAGAVATQHLATVLNSHRSEASDAPFDAFINSRNKDERKALEAFVRRASSTWRQQEGSPISVDTLRALLRATWVETYDFGVAQHHERTAKTNLRKYVVSDAAQANRAWIILEHNFTAADEQGTTATKASLRQLLSAANIATAAAPEYDTDIKYLAKLTKQNLERLRENTVLRFGSKSTDVIHLARSDDVDALSSAIKKHDLLLTGDPGCGKSGLVHDVTNNLQQTEIPVLLLLAEEIFGTGYNYNGSIPGLKHSLDDVLSNWPSGARGHVLTDALDAVRDPEIQRMVRRLLEDIRTGESKWLVIASVREFDLKHSRELRDTFPGDGVENHSAAEFAGVSHFFLSGLSDSDVDELAKRRPEIAPFLRSAADNPKSEALHRSPFYLSLAAALLRDGVTPARLADWNSPAVLLRSFWSARVESGAEAEERQALVGSVCREMVTGRTMSVSITNRSYSPQELRAIRDLRSRGIFQSPILQYGTPIQADIIRFTHHLLHDYAIARTYIPTEVEQFCQFAIANPLLPVFYRQSFMFALEEIWDSDRSRNAFWNVAIRFENETGLHGITRILAPILAARRVESLPDLAPLLSAMATSPNNEAALNALRHLASGVQDVSRESFTAGAAAWAQFADALAQLLPSSPAIEGPLVHILARLNSVDDSKYQ